MSFSEFPSQDVNERWVSQPERLGLEVLEKTIFLLERDGSGLGESSQDRRCVEYAVDIPNHFCGRDFRFPLSHSDKRSARIMLFEERETGQKLTRVSLSVPLSDFDTQMFTLTFADGPVPRLTERIGDLLKLLQKRNEEDDPSFPFRREATPDDLREFLWLLGQVRKC